MSHPSEQQIFELKQTKNEIVTQWPHKNVHFIEVFFFFISFKVCMRQRFQINRIHQTKTKSGKKRQISFGAALSWNERACMCRKIKSFDSFCVIFVSHAKKSNANGCISGYKQT